MHAYRPPYRSLGRYFCYLFIFAVVYAVWYSSPAHAGKQPTARKPAASGKKTAAPAAAKKRTPKAKIARKSPTSVKKKTTAKTGAAPKSQPPLAVASVAHKAKLHKVPDQLKLTAAVAYVIDKNTGDILLGKNEGAILPIASLTKIMTALMIFTSNLPMNEVITIVDADGYPKSRLASNTQITRLEAVKLMLMSSENRAAHALARTWPEGEKAFISGMNTMARNLGMKSTKFVDSSGLSAENQSNAPDIAILVEAAARSHPLLREYTISKNHTVAVGKNKETIKYANSNKLLKKEHWDIGFQKTGFLNAAGGCLAMLTKIAGREFIMVFLAAANPDARLADAERVRVWVEKEITQQGRKTKAVP